MVYYDDGTAWARRGDNFIKAGQTEKAEKAFQRAVELSGNPYFRLRLGTTQLALGKWKEGFKNDYTRWDPSVRYKGDLAEIKAPRWQGEDLKHKTVLLHTEGGQGDQILSLRYIDLFKSRFPATRVVTFSESFSSLIPPHHGEDQWLIEAYGPQLDGPKPVLLLNRERLDKLRNFDYKCSLLDVPMWLGLEYSDIPRPVSYLGVDCKRKDKLPKGFNIGFCFESKDGLKKLSYDDAHPILLFKDVNWISLRKPSPATFPRVDYLIDLANEIQGWEDTAAIIQSLDLVISVDTAIAHLAGALGKPVWCFSHFGNYWPWMHPKLFPASGYSHWYPTMWLLRQTHPNTWRDPMLSAAEQLYLKLKAV